MSFYIHPLRVEELWERSSTLTLFGKEISPSDDEVTLCHYIIDIVD